MKPLQGFQHAAGAFQLAVVDVGHAGQRLCQQGLAIGHGHAGQSGLEQRQVVQRVARHQRALGRQAQRLQCLEQGRSFLHAARLDIKVLFVRKQHVKPHRQDQVAHGVGQRLVGVKT